MNEAALDVVHIVDDDESFLRSMARLFSASGYRVRTFACAEDLLAELTPDAQGCVVADLCLPGKSGLELQEALAQAGCVMPVVFVTGHGGIPDSVRAMRNGAEDFLTKQAPLPDLLAAVQRALERGARERAEHHRVRDLCARLRLLTNREREVLALVVQGRMNKEIADALAIHERTVKLHRTSITNKLQVHSVAELTRLVIEAQAHGAAIGGH